ncbi:hypothetical protein SAMN04487859_10317 [Roseovarius lutimaris]|uniref:Uncharacterized protein n=1 Tax=Roseovarius lutimaris TaxID=1005928 RepID=A0A1I4Z9G5_9RHOB|nr:hypothetical protein [Roseovarius lutimaris]SFN46599.1 hypothetical protein SAMN04487859_10317 [Roseovarius lutimaris]
MAETEKKPIEQPISSGKPTYREIIKENDNSLSRKMPKDQDN